MPAGPRKVLVAVFVFLYTPIAYWFGFYPMYGIQFDFPSFYYGARSVFNQGTSPYGLEKFHSASVVLGRKVHPYLYPPPSLLAFWPFAWLRVDQAQAVFLVASHLCLLGSLWLLLFKFTPPATPLRRHLTLFSIVVYVLMFDPMLITLALGQINLIVLLFLCPASGAIGCAAGRLWRRGALCALHLEPKPERLCDAPDRAQRVRSLTH